MLLIFLFGLAPMLTAFNAAPVGWGKNYKLSALNKSEVKNLKGEGLGEIEDFVMDLQNGRIAWVIFCGASVC